MTQIINADLLQETLKQEISFMVETTKNSYEITKDPTVVIITATKDASSHRYVANKLKMAKELGINAIKLEFDESISTDELEQEINKLNNDDNIDGIILQLPIYEHLEEDYLLNVIDFDKDVDGLTLMSKAFLENNHINFMPCTPQGVLLLLESYGIGYDNIASKNVVVIGRGHTAGAPMSILFRHLDANVTLLHSKTKAKDLESYIRNADIVVSCVGKRYLLKADWFKEGSIVIGVGFEYDESGKQHLDFEVDKVVELGKAKFVSQRTNCTGKATVLSLLFNTATSYARRVMEEQE